MVWCAVQIVQIRILHAVFWAVAAAKKVSVRQETSAGALATTKTKRKRIVSRHEYGSAIGI
jgi:hypothetical protein